MQRLRFRSGSDAPRYDYGSRVSAAVLRAARSASISANQAIAFSLESVRRPSKVMVTSSEVGGPPISAAAHSSPVIVGLTDKDTSDQAKFGGSHFGPLTWAFGGGEGTRTLGLCVAKVWLAVF
jgi:hypothetical protein